MDQNKLNFIKRILSDALDGEECFKDEIGEENCLCCNISKAIDFIQEEVDNG